MIKELGISVLRNSRGDKTVKVCINSKYCASSPSGKSKGRHEARELPVSRVIKNFRRMKHGFTGMESFGAVDRKLERLGINKVGGNFSIALSMASVRMEGNGQAYRALGRAKAFPYPLGNVVGGGAHGGNTDIQEFLVFPKKARTMAEALKTNRKIWEQVGKKLKARKKNDEGAWMAKADDYKTLDVLTDIAERNCALVGIDMAATQLYAKGNYVYKKLGMRMDDGLQMDFVEGLIRKYRLAYVEDPFHEEDYTSFRKLTRKVRCMVCGDDIFATQAKRMRRVANAMIIKPNQAGTVSRTLKAIEKAKKMKMVTVVSHRSGETMDPFISDLAVATGAQLIKCGVYGRERVAKHKRLVELWKKAERPRMIRGI